MQLTRKIAGLVLGFCITLCACAPKGELVIAQKETEESEETSEVLSAETEPAFIYVYICGAVREPGVYPMENGSRIYQAIEKAGGMTEEAAGDYVNQAGALADGQQVYIPTRDEAEESGGIIAEAAPSEAEGGSGLININQADAALLMTLPGIGEARAAAIISYREGAGAFGTIEDIMNVEGIKDGVFQKIKDRITI